MADREDSEASRPDRFEALALARCRVRSEDAMRTVGRTHGVGFAELVESLSRASGTAEAAITPAPAEPRWPWSGREHMDFWRKDAAATNTVALRPLAGGRRFIKAPRRVVPADPASQLKSDLPSDEAVWVLAIAPDYYDKDDVDGTETPVILDPIRRWAKHAVLKDDEIYPKDARRAWEAFSSDGDPVGLVLQVRHGFAGVDMSGDVRSERTLAGVVWQIAVSS